MTNIVNTNQVLKNLNKNIDILQNAPGLLFNTDEVIINTLNSETENKIVVSLGKRPSLPQTVQYEVESATGSEPPTGFRFGRTFIRDEDTGTLTKIIGTITNNGSDKTYTTETYTFTPDNTPVEVYVEIENPNPVVLSIEPSELIFNQDNWNEPQEVTFSLVERVRYATEHYYDIKFKVSSEQADPSYEENVYYMNFSLISANRRTNYFKGREVDTVENYSHPVNFSSEKKIKIVGFQIIGCVLQGYFTHNPSIEFGGEFFDPDNTDVLDIIAATIGVDPELIIIPGDIPRYATPSSPPLDDTIYSITGLDGRSFRKNGQPKITSNVSKFPKTIEISISDKKFYNFNLSEFTIVDSPNAPNNQADFTALNRAVMEISINEEFDANELIRIMPNGDAVFYVYAKVYGQESDWLNFDEWCDEGFRIYRQFVLKPIIEHTENVWDPHTGTITHTFTQRSDGTKLIYTDTHNTYENKTGYTFFKKETDSTELYYKKFLTNSGNSYKEIIFNNEKLESPDTQAVEDTIDNTITGFDYYNSYDSDYPKGLGGEWYDYVEFPYVRVDHNADFPYIYINNLDTESSFNRYSDEDTSTSFTMDYQNLDADTSIFCNTNLINDYNLKITDFN